MVYLHTHSYDAVATGSYLHGYCPITGFTGSENPISGKKTWNFSRIYSKHSLFGQYFKRASTASLYVQIPAVYERPSNPKLADDDAEQYAVRHQDGLARPSTLHLSRSYQTQPTVYNPTNESTIIINIIYELLCSYMFRHQICHLQGARSVISLNYIYTNAVCVKINKVFRYSNWNFAAS